MLPVDEPPLTSDLIGERHARLVARLRQAAEGSGRDPDAFRLVAVTKGFSADVVRLALEAGLRRFGENRVQEALPKVAAAPDADWHLVGHLQSNKARPAIGAFAWLHSVDDLGLLARLEAIAHDTDRHPDLLLQVNVSREATRSGFDADCDVGSHQHGYAFRNDYAAAYVHSVGDTHCAIGTRNTRAASATLRPW